MDKSVLTKTTIIFFTIILTIFAATTVFAALDDGSDLDSTATDDVYWLIEPTNIYELSLQEFRFVIEETSSTLSNFELTVAGATILEMRNPIGCTLTSTTAACPTSELPLVYVNISEVEEDTNFTWEVMTNDTTDGVEYWNLTLEVLNDTSSPTISSISPESNTTITNGTINFTIIGDDDQSAIDSTTLYYYSNSSYSESINTSSNETQTLDFTCLDNTCSASLDTSDLSQSTFIDAIIRVLDRAGNTIEQTLHYFIDLSTPTINEDNFQNVTTNNDSLTINIETTDDSLEQSIGYDSYINCTVEMDNLTSQSQTTTTNANLSFTVDTSSLDDGAYNWQVTCVDSTNNQVQSQQYTITLDNAGPSISCEQDSQTIAQNETINITVEDTHSQVQTVNTSYSYQENATTQTVTSQTLTNPYQVQADSWDEGDVTLEITATDELGNLAHSTCTVSVDTTAPTVSNVTLETVSESELRIEAIATESLSYTIYYGTTNDSLTAYNQTTSTNLSQVIQGLNSGTSYFVLLESCDGVNNCVNSSILTQSTSSAASSSSSSGGGGSSSRRTVEEEEEVFECNDGIDNDGDGLIDDPDDPGCTIATDDSENSDVPKSEQEETQVAQEEEIEDQNSAIDQEEESSEQNTDNTGANALTGAAVAGTGALNFKNFSIAGKVTAIGIPLIILLILLFYFVRERQQKKGRWH